MQELLHSCRSGVLVSPRPFDPAEIYYKYDSADLKSRKFSTWDPCDGGLLPSIPLLGADERPGLLTMSGGRRSLLHTLLLGSTPGLLPDGRERPAA